MSTRCLLLLSLLLPLPAPTRADEYGERVQPFVQRYCLTCHNQDKARGELDLTRYAKTSDVTGHFRRWNGIIEFIRGGEMPPEDATEVPTLEERKAVVAAVEAMLLAEARKHAGDPGVILPRRLSNTEYDTTIRDLTGLDIRPTREFPADPAAGEGFNNTGEALTMSPSLLKKYLAAAEEVSQHLVLKPDGIEFAPFPVTSYNEREKLAAQAVIDFYHRHEVRLRDYLIAAWSYRHRGDADQQTKLESWATRRNLSSQYLALVWETLNSASSGSGWLKQLGERWNALPAPQENGEIPGELAALEQFIEACRRRLGYPEGELIKSNAGNWPIAHLDFRTRTARQRDQFNPAALQPRQLLSFGPVHAPRRLDTSTLPLTLHLNSALDISQGNYVLLRKPVFSRGNALPRNETEEKQDEVLTLRTFLETHAPELAARLNFGKHPQGHAIDADSLVLQAPAVLEIRLSPELRRELDGKSLLMSCELDDPQSREGCVQLQYAVGPLENQASGRTELLVHADSQSGKAIAESAGKFCRTFPNRFYYVDPDRGLAAGFHLVEGFFRDDLPLMEKVLNDQEQQDLNRLWEELHFVTQSTENLLRGFVWFERSERHVLHDKRFDFLRSEDPRLVQREMLDRFERVYLEKLGVKLHQDKLEPIQADERFTLVHGFFEQIRTGLTHHRGLLQQAEAAGLRDLEALARRAWRRSLLPEELESLTQLYRQLRTQGQSEEDALRGAFIAVLMSPDFCYRFTHVPEGPAIYPLSDTALASRLSFFLWSSLPDEELLRAAAAGELQDVEQLQAQTNRMRKDLRIDAFAREFLGQWLRYRDYLAKDAIDAGSFPEYDEPLRQAMFEEPTRLATWLIQADRPITDLLNSDTTFINGRLAKHYGGEIEQQYRQQLDQWLADRRQLGAAAPAQPEETWLRISGLRSAGRGGLFGMGVILTRNSAGARTSPVKRGFWTVHHLLGQHFPPPPADVPELPKSETQATKSIRELLTEHTANKRCALCHTHFDSLGMALEGFDPIGRTRRLDLAGREVDTAALLPDGTTARGIPGLIDYIEQQRRDDFVRNFCRKFLGYALGRSVLLSDQPLLHEMETRLKENDYRFSVLFEVVIHSPQFRTQRGRGFPTASGG